MRACNYCNCVCVCVCAHVCVCDTNTGHVYHVEAIPGNATLEWLPAQLDLVLKLSVSTDCNSQVRVHRYLQMHAAVSRAHSRAACSSALIPIDVDMQLQGICICIAINACMQVSRDAGVLRDHLQSMFFNTNSSVVHRRWRPSCTVVESTLHHY